MNKTKKILALTLATAVLINASMVTSSAIEPTSTGTTATAEDFKSYIAYSLMANEAISDFENQYGATFDFALSDINENNFSFDDEWLEDSMAFVNDFIDENTNPLSRTVYEPTPTTLQTAKATAIMYAIDRAEFSVGRNPSLDFGKEAQYMFISHYIDVPSPYWESGGINALLNGHTWSGVNGRLADRLTPTDRQAYENYMRSTNIWNAMQSIGNIAMAVRSFGGLKDNINHGIEALSNADYILALAHGMVLQDGTLNTADVISNDMIPFINILFTDLADNPTQSLSDLFDYYVEDANYLSAYEPFDKSTIIRTAIAAVGSFIIAGPVGVAGTAVSLIAGEVLSMTLDAYVNFFHYASWVTLRYGFSGRYADRYYMYIFG